MISVPYTIKELYHQDHCYKNIRIHFPNGERTDICNDLIVKDSVSFTESLCSQNTLKFGLCESPVFECEVVGVGNIKGAKIEVSVEIECPFSASGAEWKADLQKHVYSIPYGTFIVDSCKRQADMQHRKIVAYNKLSYGEWEFAKVEQEKHNKISGYEAPIYDPILAYWLGGNGLDFVEEFCDVAERASSNNYVSRLISGYIRTYVAPNIDVLTYVQGKSLAWRHQAPDDDYTYYDDYNKLFRYETYYTCDFVDVQRRVRAFLIEECYADDHYINQAVNRIVDVMHGYYCYLDGHHSQIETWESANKLQSKFFYPYCVNYYNTSGSYRRGLELVIPTKIIITGVRSPRQELEINLQDPNDIKFYALTVKNDYPVLQTHKLSFPTSEFVDYYNETYYYPNYSDVSLRDYANAFVELFGVFAYWNRDNASEIVNLKRQFGLAPETNLYPGTSVYPEGVTGGLLHPHEYESCWYDDEYSKPFGLIQCQYKNENNEGCVYYYYLTGYDDASLKDSYLTYDLSDNLIIKSYLWTEAQIQEFCENIADNLEGVSYMPVEFKGLGLPYVEAGDTFEILTRSSDSITTIVLNRTLTGEMTLKDTYKSV